VALNHRLIPAWDFALLAHRSSWPSSPGLGWQAIVTLIGLTVIRVNRWYANIPGLNW